MKDLSKYVSVTHRRTQMFYTENLEKLEITSGQFMYIVCICENAGQTQDELSQRLIIDKSTVAKVLSQLETKGFITKTINSNDRRAFNIFPTDKAMDIYPQILEIKDEWHHRLTENLSDIECDVFQKLMEKVMENSIKNCKKYV
ncbi:MULTISPECIES: MarR family winged helix-turn-helix transcriptional regulator [Clostridium]|uniref:Multiple antibiotic resistance protein MarR n=3 Tax=Clostridium TaxID=1485 RepID=D8GM35_CLOLD|nr:MULTISPECIES: MarR family transcriptional regulator [Clostridium]ADK15609.1 predicted ranscriptional regulator, MarR family [Clostridium ljungdahlii DSM 13528]AGY74849.1 MarR family transcriptional regulator [Clostridium autoethanogenum DSM 10061]ALU35026.1 Transcriptional regulator MarR family [Clostridium autoethanogenum DSM 10061]OAA86490.1 Multiple antibiotic resistance protein MarR [Clostridium ljungdahlii DSM 13528]OVY49475.1 Multiple antibiotic resistance protein MarR [Clostridium au